MKIYAVDFEKVIKNYKGYVNGLADLDKSKAKHQEEMSVFKKEMETIINSANSGLIMDEATQKRNLQRFKDLQVEASQKDNEFRTKFTEQQNSIMENNFNEVSIIIDEYAKSASIDMIFSKSQMVYLNNLYDATDVVIDVIKKKDLYLETEKES